MLYGLHCIGIAMLSTIGHINILQLFVYLMIISFYLFTYLIVISFPEKAGFVILFYRDEEDINKDIY